jgi:hypothetical protein
MNQTNQKITQEPSLPIKTKIAAWWMVVIGGIGIIFSLILLGWLISIREETNINPVLVLIYFINVFPPSFLYFLTGFLLHLKRKRWAWFFGITIIIVVIIFFNIIGFASGIAKKIGVKPIYFYIFLLMPFLLLLLDRKNFWKIAT